MFGWGPDDIDSLIARKKHGRAIKLIRQQLTEHPGNVRLRQLLADLLALEGDTKEAVQLLARLVDELVDGGFFAKAIAVLKKIERIDPGQSSVERRLAALAQRKAEAEAGPAGASVPQRGVPGTAELEVVRLPDEREPEPPSEVDGMLRSPLFSDFAEDELLAVIRGLRLETFAPGEVLVTEGEPGDSLFVLASGSVRVYALNPAGRNEQLRLLHPGEFFGEISLLSGKPRSATVTAATPCEILELDRAALTEIAAQNPKVPVIIQHFYQQRENSPEEVVVRSNIDIPL